MNIISAKTAAKKYDLSIASFYRQVKLGNIPKQVPLTKQRVGWIEEELDANIRSRMDQREAV